MAHRMWDQWIYAIYKERWDEIAALFCGPGLDFTHNCRAVAVAVPSGPPASSLPKQKSELCPPLTDQRVADEGARTASSDSGY